MFGTTLASPHIALALALALPSPRGERSGPMITSMTKARVGGARSRPTGMADDQTPQSSTASEIDDQSRRA